MPTHNPNSHVIPVPAELIDHLEPFGQLDDIHAARAAVSAQRDNCQPCFTWAVNELAQRPAAMVTLRRILADASGQPVRPVRGSREEADQLRAIEEATTATRTGTLRALIVSAVEVASRECREGH